MAPFPETESMTIKRLEVALRKSDMPLLKDGAYKLHEKFHTGHKFEYKNELRQILNYVEAHAIPEDIKEILCPTIKEILSDAPNVDFVEETTNEKDEANKIQNETVVEENKTNVNSTAGLYSPYSTSYVQNSIQSYVTSNDEASYKENEVEEEKIKPEIKIEEATLPKEETVSKTTSQIQEKIEEKEEIKEEIVKETTTPEEKEPVLQNIAIFYDDTSFDTDFRAIKNYRNTLNNLFSRQNDAFDFNLLKEVGTILNLTDTKVENLDKILSTFSTAKGKVTLVTTCQSENITKLLDEKGIDFKIPYTKEAKNDEAALTLIPMLGLSNIFVCSDCNRRTLVENSTTKPLSTRCPNCDGASFPDVYAINSYNPDCNPIYWQRALGAMASADVWVLINPPFDENKEIIFDFIKTAATCTKAKSIYILSKEGEKKEYYRQMFNEMLKDAQVKSNFLTQEALCEDYIKTEITDKVYA